MNNVATLADLKAEFDQQNRSGNFSLTVENSFVFKIPHQVGELSR